MSKSKHTKGNWEIPSGATRKVHSGCDKDKLIANTESPDMSIEEAEANAVLIATSPELLAALKDAREWVNVWDLTTSSTWNQVDQAILENIDKLITKIKKGA